MLHRLCLSRRRGLGALGALGALLTGLLGAQGAQAFSEDICYRYTNAQRTALNPAPFNCWDMQCKDGDGVLLTTKGSCAASGAVTYAEASIVQDMHVRNTLHFDVLYLLGRLHGLNKTDARTLAVHGEAPDLGEYVHFDVSGRTVLARSDDMAGLERTNTSTPGMWWHFLPWVQPDCAATPSSCQTESTLTYRPDSGTASPFPATELPLAHIRAWAFGTQSQLCQFGLTRSGAAEGDCFDATSPTTLYWDVPLVRGTENTEVRVKPTQTLQWQPVKPVASGTAGSSCFDQPEPGGSVTTVCFDGTYSSATARSLKALGAYLHALGDRLSHYHCSDGSFISTTWQGEGTPDNPAANRFLYYPDICGTIAHAMFHYPETGLQTLPERSLKMIEFAHLEIRQWARLFMAGSLATVTPRAGFPDPAKASAAEIVQMIATAVGQGAAADRLSALCRIARNGYGLEWHDNNNVTCSYPTDASNPKPTTTASLSALDAGTARNKRVQAVVTPAAADLGQSGSIFIAALTPAEGWVFLTPQGFVPWSGSGVMPAYFTGELRALSVSVLDGTLDLRGYRGTDIFVGYGRSADEMLASRRHVKASTLQGRRER